MKLNINTLKVGLAFLVIAGVIFWVITSTRAMSYSGANLAFDVGGGAVSITNPSDEPVTAQLLGTGFGTFRFVSTIEDSSGSSVREGSGSTAIQSFEFIVPPGTHEFTVARGTDVTFVAITDTRLEATVNPLTSGTIQSTLIGSAIVIIVALFYASNVTKHAWIGILRGQEAPSEDLQPAAVMAGGQGRAARSYGDNRDGKDK